MANNNKTSLEKSHSAWSNTKLTTLCVLTVIFVSAFWLCLGLYNKLASLVNTAVAIISVVATFALSFLCMLGLRRFSR